MKKSIIYLTGFMAAGKSTVGPILANTIGWDFLDIDRVIEKKAGKKITEIFSDQGEEYFRLLENTTLKELSILRNYIIALGGGTIANDENLKIIKETGLLIYLKSSPETAYKRLRFKRDRPALLFQGDDEPTREEYIQRIDKLLQERRKYYEKSDYIIDTDLNPVGRTIDKIVSIIKRDIIKNEN
ncbi:MAG TPA: shikimate kinase [Ignavibacteriaceae bacterium]|nr:shikimate kinase [Ignavibacteriaceae bacterium]